MKSNLDIARNALDKAQRVFQNLLLDPANRRESEEWNNIYYSSSALSAFCTKYGKCVKAHPELKAALDDSFGTVVALWKNYEFERAAEKTRKADKRSALARKKAEREALDLQEGVKLNGVDVGQYKIILAGLEPVRLHVKSVVRKQLAAEFKAQYDALKAANWDADVAFAVEERGRKHTEFPENFLHYFKSDPAKWQTARAFVQREAFEIDKFIQNTSERRALAYVQGYAVKLAGKVGETIANDENYSHLEMVATGCSVSSNNLWSDSLAEIHCAAATKEDVLTLRFHTKIIWNQSCLGKQFNQWPTRLVA